MYVLLLGLFLAGCTGFSVEKYNLNQNFNPDGSRGEEVPGYSYKVVELYKINPFASSYTYHKIYRCTDQNVCIEEFQSPTLQPGMVSSLVAPVIQAGAIVGGAAILSEGIRKSGSTTNQNVSGGNSSANMTNNSTTNATVNANQTVNAPGSH